MTAVSLVRPRGPCSSLPARRLLKGPGMKNLLSYASFIGLVSAVPACEVQTSSTSDVAQLDNTNVGTTTTIIPMIPLTTDACDDPTFAGVDYQSKATAHFILQ